MQKKTKKKTTKAAKKDIKACDIHNQALAKTGEAMPKACICSLLESKEETKNEKDKKVEKTDEIFVNCGSQIQNNYHTTLNPTARINLSVKKINHPITAGVKC